MNLEVPGSAQIAFELDARLRCERDCTRLCNDFVSTIDRCDYAAFVALFSEDGVLDRAGDVSRGHLAIRAFLDARPRYRVTRHACSNIRIDMTGVATATGTCLAVMYHATAEPDVPHPWPASSPVVVDYRDNYVLTDDGWKFRRRTVTIVFQPAIV